MTIYFNFFSCIISCTTQTNKVSSKLNSNRKINLDVSKINIHSTIPTYSLHDIYNDKKSSYLLILDKRTEYIEIINLDNLKTITSKPLSNITNRPLFDDNTFSIEFVNFDSIFILQEYKVLLIDTLKEKTSFNINTDNNNNLNKDLQHLKLTNMDFSPIYYDRSNHSLTIESYCVDCYFYEKKFYESPIQIMLLLDSLKIKALPIRYPEVYKKKYFGFNNFVFKAEYEDKMIIGFSAHPSLYVYNKSTQSIDRFEGASSYQTLEIKPLKKKFKHDSNAKLKHLTLSPIYKETFYDEKRKLYYRFFLTGIPEKNSDGTYNAWEDKALILIVFDDQLRKINEYNLGKSIYNSSKSFVGPDGLYLYKFQDKKSTNQDSINYDIYQFK
ncbi:MAG: DUF4221 family protein [Saprospiraceae bacterium]|nr:DUF4221 family protein [Saprospiraceae bacterium]